MFIVVGVCAVLVFRVMVFQAQESNTGAFMICRVLRGLLTSLWHGVCLSASDGFQDPLPGPEYQVMPLLVAVISAWSNIPTPNHSPTF